MPQLSIIVPIYNVQDYLRECLDSILNQGLDSVEVILVNDGSTDASGNIARSYVEEYSCFTLIEQENQGLSVARNVGIENAKGKYILFLDSDDYLLNSGVSKLLKKIDENQLDLIVGNYKQISDDGELKSNKFDEISSPFYGRSWFKERLKKHQHEPAAWLRIYRRSYLLENKLFFVPQLINEDQLFSIQLFCTDPKMMCLDTVFYYYRQRSGSITKKQDFESCVRRLKSDIYTFEQSLMLSETLNDVDLKFYIARQCMSLLDSSSLKLMFLTNAQFDGLGDIIARLNQLRLWRYIRVRKPRSLKRKILLLLSIKLYLNYIYKRKLKRINRN